MKTRQAPTPEMLTGPALGAALKKAMKLKGVTQQVVATEFGVTQPSVAEWIKHGRIDKKHLLHLHGYFADVVAPEHWGLPSTYRTEGSHAAVNDPLGDVIAYVKELHDRDPQRFQRLVGDLKTLIESVRASDEVFRSLGSKGYHADPQATDTHIAGSAEPGGLSGFGSLTEIDIQRKAQGSE